MRRNETPETRSVRLLRVGEQVRHSLSDLLQRGEVRDDLIEQTVISISEVRMSPDLKVATAFVAPPRLPRPSTMPLHSPPPPER